MYTVFTEECIVPYVDGAFHFKFDITLSSHLIVSDKVVARSARSMNSWSVSLRAGNLL